MTRCRPFGKHVYHQTDSRCEGRPLLVAETADALLLRLKGCREVLALPWSIAHIKAAYLAADHKKQQQHRKSSIKRGILALSKGGAA